MKDSCEESIYNIMQAFNKKTGLTFKHSRFFDENEVKSVLESVIKLYTEC